MINKTRISAIILAGGRGQRMGGADKGLVQWRGATLISQVISRLSPQVDDIQISCNRHFADYRALGYAVVEDTMAGFQGPLAGIQACLENTKHSLCLVCPCDTPAIPDNLTELLATALVAQSADVAYLSTADQHHYIPALFHTRINASLNAYLQDGGRSIYRWYRHLKVATVEWGDDDDNNNLANINSL
ncbi:MAG: molybdopterin-guanine dinucleotide biosynthesis protein A [Paraglaciecola psychrophila]|jgi:molybdopterin-guanine dinucleotide biosynthesis protein A